MIGASTYHRVKNDLGSYIMGCQINAPVFKQQEYKEQLSSREITGIIFMYHF